MPISDLTGTTWTFNSEFTSSDNFYYDLEFISNDTTYSSFHSVVDLRSTSYFYGDDLVASGLGELDGGPNIESWENESYRTIYITGGTDVSNNDLITFLNENATQVPVGDLTGTTWFFNDSIDVSVEGNSYSINFNSNNLNYSEIRYGEVANYRIYYDSTSVYSSSWNDDNYKTITITGGTDIANPDLIVWLTQNAVLQEPTPTPSAGISLGNLPISKMLLGDLEVQAVYYGNVKIYESSTPPGPTPISDLTGTTWTLNSPFDWSINSDSTQTFDVTFQSNNSVYDQIIINPNTERVRYYLFGTYTDVTYADGSFRDEGLRTININDVTSDNDIFYNWLTANAVQQ